VTPGLVDLHTHVYPYGSAIGIPADELVAHQCTTTCVSAGDAGANNFAAFRRHIAAQTRTRLYAFVHIANMGLTPFPVAELYNIDFAQTDVAARAIAENADMVLGAKVTVADWWLWNQIPVTLGNLVGGFIFTGLAIYLTYRPRLVADRPVADRPVPESARVGMPSRVAAE